MCSSEVDSQVFWCSVWFYKSLIIARSDLRHRSSHTRIIHCHLAVNPAPSYKYPCCQFLLSTVPKGKRFLGLPPGGQRRQSLSCVCCLDPSSFFSRRKKPIRKMFPCRSACPWPAIQDGSEDSQLRVCLASMLSPPQSCVWEM